MCLIALKIIHKPKKKGPKNRMVFPIILLINDLPGEEENSSIKTMAVNKAFR